MNNMRNQIQSIRTDCQNAANKMHWCINWAWRGILNRSRIPCSACKTRFALGFCDLKRTSC